MQTAEGSLCLCVDIWKEHPTDGKSQSDRSEQSDVMMPDQQPASEQIHTPANGNSVDTFAAADSVAADSLDNSTHAVDSTGAADACAPAAASADDAAAAAKPPRVFKMSDEFLMFKFKIEMCSRKDRHDWKICPYAHPGEVARRRHPRGYTAVLCPAKTAASCPRREQCTFAHNPFEFWLHPDRFKTSLCNQGPTCDRPICFFAHKDEEVRRLANGLEAAGPDDYVYATAASTPEPHSTADTAPPPPPPPPPPRAYSLGAAGLGFLQNNAVVAAAAAAAAAAVSLNGAGLRLGPAAASPHQLLLLGGEDQLMQATAGAGLLGPDGSNGLCGSTWLHSNSDPTLLTTGRQLCAASPVPLSNGQSVPGSRGFRSQLDVGSSMGMMPRSLDAAAAGLAAGNYGAFHPSLLASTAAGMSLAQQLSSNAASLAAAAHMAGTKMAGSAPAGHTLLQGADMATGGHHHQQLLQQLQLEQQQQQYNQQQQMVNDQLLLQQMIMQQQQQQQVSGNADLQQLVQQQQQALQQLHLCQQLQQQPVSVQQPIQHWASSSLLSSQPQLTASQGIPSQLLWQQQQQLETQYAPSSFRSSGSLASPDTGHLAAALSASALTASGQLGTSNGTAPLVGSVQLQGMYQPVSGNVLTVPQQNSLKWSSSILSKQSRPGPVSPPLQLSAQTSADLQVQLAMSQ